VKNVLHLQNQLNIACGVSKNIYLIIKYSDKRYKHFVAALGGDGFNRFHSINNYPESISVGTLPLLIFPRLIIYIIGACKKNNIDIVHSHHRQFDTIVWVVSKLLKVKTVMSVQSKVYGKKVLSYKSDILIACSETIKNHLINHFNIKPGRITIINNCVDTSEVILVQDISYLKKELNIPNSGNVIGFFGRFSFEEKGLDLLLKVFSELILEDEKLFLLLIGTGPDEKSILDFKRRYPERIILFNPQDDLTKFFSLIDLFILPSRVDPFPHVMLESGFFKKPFVGSNVDGIAELIRNGENGLLFEKGETAGLKNCIVKLLKDKNYANELAQKLHEEITDKYSAKTIIPKYYSLYDSITAG